MIKKHNAVVFRYDPTIDMGSGGWVATCECHTVFRNVTRTGCVMSWVAHTIIETGE